MKRSKLRASLLLVMLLVVTMLSGCNKKATEKEYEKGIIKDDGYESEYLNIKFTTPEGYSMLSEDVLNEYIQFTSEIIYTDKDQTKIDYAKAVNVYEMMCVEEVTNSPNINIVVENLLGRKISVADYIEASKQQLQATGIEYTFGDITEDVELAGEKYTLLECVGNYAGQEVLQEMYIRKVGGRMMILSITYTEDTVEAKDTLVAGLSEYK